VGWLGGGWHCVSIRTVFPEKRLPALMGAGSCARIRQGEGLERNYMMTRRPDQKRKSEIGLHLVRGPS